MLDLKDGAELLNLWVEQDTPDAVRRDIEQMTAAMLAGLKIPKELFERVTGHRVSQEAYEHAMTPIKDLKRGGPCST